MISTYQRLKRRRDAGEIDGFTLIELLIVIVVLGILAAVVIFALGGITGKSALASCQADGATVSTTLAAFNAQNPTTFNNVVGSGTTTPVVPTTFGPASNYTYYGLNSAGTAYSAGVSNFPGTIAIGTPAANATTPTADAAMESILSSTSYQGPYIQSWPSNPSHYGFVLGWVLTSPGVASPATAPTWSAQLFVVTGDGYASGPAYAAGPLNGALSASIINSATPVGTGLTTTVPALYPYTGPSSCAGVA